MKALIVVDFQNDFVCGALGFEQAKQLDAPLAEYIDKKRAQGYDIIFTLDTHDSGYLKTKEGIKLPVEHCVKGKPGFELYGETAFRLKEGDRVFEKHSFGSAELFEYLRTSNYDEIELAGLVSNICVLVNAVLAQTALPEAQIKIAGSLTSSADTDLHKKAFDVLKGIHIDII